MRTAVLLVAGALVGCGGTSAPTEKYFSGEPVAHWLGGIKSADPKVRKRAADVLGNVGPADPGAVPALALAARDRDPKVRAAAVLALSKIGTAAVAAAGALDEAARDTDPTVRAHAATALRRVRGEL